MRTPWTATVLTILPNVFPGPLGASLIGSALENGTWALHTIDTREFAEDKHRSVDDTPAGGGPGMVMRPDVVGRAVDAATAKSPDAPVVFLSPRGKPLDQARVRELAQGPGVTALCGRFEGLDERVIAARNIEEISIGDYVLAGGEVAACVLIEACVRLLPGVIGDAASLEQESFEQGLLEYPHYTRPRTWEGLEIPEVLLSGDHGKIAEWRRAQAEAITKERRPDLWSRRKK
ncbi:MAG: tRNA (guanosine(37)-N1)-methyltransferase TrmD [Hyphomicrobiaceae bacterium]|nr:tRNA (guanosine(37)-N1)-methyltransferase TrmD [Hyphomicrobiaceae bacterium]